MRPTDAYVGREILGNQFKVLERIGSGGMGAVYKAQQPSMDRFVGVKILHSKFTNRKDLVSRFRREARAMSHLTHPNTAKVFLYGQLEDNACYIVMEYLEGKNLGQVVRHEGPMAPARAIAVLIQACGALEEAHQKGIVHRDLKPENIFLCKQGGIEDFVKVLDFGLAKVTEREMQPGSLILTQEGMVFGTPEFMSPEQAQGKTLDPRSDVYSLAVILYELLTGKLPFDARSPMEFITLHVQAKPIPLAQRAPTREFPRGLEEVIRKAMAKNPDERYQSAAEFAHDLASLVRDDPAVAQALSAIPDNSMALAATMASRGSGGAKSDFPPSMNSDRPPPDPVQGVGNAAPAQPSAVSSDGYSSKATPISAAEVKPSTGLGGQVPGGNPNTGGGGAPMAMASVGGGGLTTEPRRGLSTALLISIGVLIGLAVAFAMLGLFMRGR